MFSTERPNEESELISGMSFLYENYKDDAWYWELVEVVRKLILTCGIILIGRESRAYVGLASICSGLFAIFYAFRKPIRDEFEDKLQLTSLLVIFLNLGIGVILKIPKESVPSDVDQYVDSLLVNILVVGANVLVIVLVVGMSIKKLLKSFISTTKAHVRVVYKNSLVYQQFIGFSIFIYSFIYSFIPFSLYIDSLSVLSKTLQQASSMAFNTEELLQLMLGPKVKIWLKSERAHRLFTFCLQGVSFYERILIHELQVTI